MSGLNGSFSRVFFAIIAVMLPGTLGGCSLFVMAGKMLIGDPKVESPFSAQTGVDLTKGKHELLVICNTPSLMKSELPTFEHDLTRQILWNLKQQGIKITSADKVAHWLDDNGGEIDNLGDIARDFDADFIATVKVREASFTEENSNDLFRGRANGSISVYEVKKVDSHKDVLQVFSGEFRTEHPKLNPVPRTSMSERVFQKQFVDHLAANVARRFYDYSRQDEF